MSDEYRQRPEAAAYKEFPESREGYLQEWLAQARQTQVNTARLVFGGGIAALAIVALLMLILTRLPA